MAVRHNKGKVRDNALKALVRSNVFRPKTERKKKGRGSYCRKHAAKIRDVFREGVPEVFRAPAGGGRCFQVA